MKVYIRKFDKKMYFFIFINIHYFTKIYGWKIVYRLKSKFLLGRNLKVKIGSKLKIFIDLEISSRNKNFEIRLRFWLKNTAKYLKNSVRVNKIKICIVSKSKIGLETEILSKSKKSTQY